MSLLSLVHNSKVVFVGNAKDWIKELDKRFGIKNTRLHETNEAFTVFMATPKLINLNIMVGRYCKVDKYGVILDRRGNDR